MNKINWESFGLCKISRSDAVEIFAWTFSDGAFHRYVLDTWKAAPNNLEYVTRNRMLFDRLLPDLEKEGAYFLSIPGSSLAIICNPTVVSDSIPTDDSPPDDIPQALVEMDAKSNAILQTLHKPERSVLHIYLLGRDTASDSSRTRGNANAHELLLRIIGFATTRGWPLYLEATSPRSRDLFKRVGFKTVREIKVGIGQVDGEGLSSDGGEGVSLWVETFDV